MIQIPAQDTSIAHTNTGGKGKVIIIGGGFGGKGMRTFCPHFGHFAGASLLIERCSCSNFARQDEHVYS